MNKTIHLRYATVYEIHEKGFINLGNTEDIFQKIHDLMDSDELDNGIYSYYSIDKKVIHHTDYNPELFWDDAMELILYQTEPYRVCRRPTFLRECSNDKTKIYP